MIKIGVIADDFTGATDIASFLVENGLPTVQINGVPTGKMPEAIDALVISLKTRSCPVVEATQQSLAALSWLQQQGCKQIYFKYCSTFDSTAKGNIGPVTDALMDALDTPFTVFSPALPVNGRTVYQGYLFVMNQLLAESGMRHHPVNPMTDSYLPRLVESQSTGRCGVVSAHVFEQGVKAVRQELARLQQEGYRYAVLDALTEHHLEIQGEALRDAPLVTGGSGLAVEALSPGVKPHYLFSSQYQALAIVEEVARDNVFIQLDTFHAQKVDGNLTHLIRDYAGKYAHVQIAGLPDRHEPDDGEINYPWLFRLFDEVGYQGWIGCEYKPRGLTEEGLGWFDAWR